VIIMDARKFLINGLAFVSSTEVGSVVVSKDATSWVLVGVRLSVLYTEEESDAVSRVVKNYLKDEQGSVWPMVVVSGAKVKGVVSHPFQDLHVVQNIVSVNLAKWKVARTTFLELMSFVQSMGTR